VRSTPRRSWRYLPIRTTASLRAPTLALISAYDGVIDMLETQLDRRLKRDPMWRLLKSIPGVGDVLAWTILLETGPIERFAQVGHYASYSRCVDSRRVSNGKKKGENNRKNGNRYLAWAFVEAAHYAIRYYAPIKRFYQRKQAKTNGIIAVKAVAHKLARAAYYVQRDKVSFQMSKAFG
jgi:transposase